MCQKNDYTRRAVTVILAVLTALFVLSAAATAINAEEVSGATAVAGGVARGATDNFVDAGDCVDFRRAENVDFC